VSDVLSRLKQELPYLLRYSSTVADRAVLTSTLAGLPNSPASRTVGEWMEWLVGRLPEWVVISLPGYLIAYPTIDPSNFGSRNGAWTNFDGVVLFTQHMAQFSPQAVQVDEESGSPEDA
jgi:hypothetical protein